MRLGKSNWRPTYLKNRVILLLISFIFVSINVVILVIDALPQKSNTTPRFYWPITILAIFVVGVLYWGVLRMLRAKGSMDMGTERTLGSRLGLEVSIYEQGDQDVPEEMKPLMRDAVRDGTRRRVQYKVRLCAWAIYVCPKD